MRQFWQNLQGWRRIWFGGVALLLGLFVFFLISYETVEYTETTEFCSSCHAVMEPQIDAHAISSHANVDCGTCHVGPGLQWKAYYKLSGLRYLWTLPFGLYERPLPPAHETLRSPDEVCVQCHSPETFHEADIITDYEYALDEENTVSQLMLAFKIGNGAEEIAGRGMGAHWHIANPVSFISPDPLRQEIPWVQVEKDGELVTYIDSTADPAIWQEADAEIATMDCLDCHSRQGHIIEKPADVVDEALANDRIAADLPYIKAQALALLDERYESEEAGLAAISSLLPAFYTDEYPQVAADRSHEINQAVTELQTIFQQTQFPHMRVYWDTYPNDIGHADFPGCMRCHSGSHLSEAGEAIPAECNLCHSIPTSMPVASDAVTATTPLHWELGAAITLGTSAMPASHESTLWLSEHRFEFDATCDDCHTIANAGGSDNSSFCSNSGCHASEWPYLNLDAPAVLELAAAQVPTGDERRLPRIPHPVVETLNCQSCHGLEQLNPFPADHEAYNDSECTDCHRPAMSVIADYTPTAVPPPAPTPTRIAVPLINHAIIGNDDCVACHAPSSNIAPASAIHEGMTNDNCTDCHALAANVAALPTWTPTVTATPLPPTATPTETPTFPPTATPLPTATTAPTTVITETAPSETATVAAVDAATSPVTSTVDSSAVNTTTVSSTTIPTDTVDSDADSSAADSSDADSSDDAGSTNEITIMPAQFTPIPHPLAGNETCLACHAVTSPIAPAPLTHSGFPLDSCQECHQPSDSTTP